MSAASKLAMVFGGTGTSILAADAMLVGTSGLPIGDKCLYEIR